MSRRLRPAILLAFLAAQLAVLAFPAAAQNSQKNNAGKPTEQAPRAKPQQQQPVSPEQATYLVRAVLLTLNDANRSGNYSVLRDLASPQFQARNNAADLAAAFTDLRRRGFDLAAAAVLAPVIQQPQLTENNQVLRLIGHFPTRPLRIDFDLMFRIVGGQWRLYGISVATPQS